MIIERHLRIGNLVARNDSKEFIISEVLGINRNFEWEYLIDSRNSDGRHRESLWISAKKCDPIPLTTEWLERCGFEMTGALGDVFIKDGVAFSMNAAGYEFEWPADHWDDDKEPNIRIIEYLHQLQNLYFALTGEELKVKL